MSFEVCDCKPSKSFLQLIIDEKEYVYPVLFYISGLIIGSFSFRLFNSSTVLNVLKSLYSVKTNSFISLFTGNFCLYFSVFMVTVLLGMCLIGYPLINAIPLVLGVVTAIKVTYFYTSYSVKGIGYSLIMIIPEASVLITTIIATINVSSKLSRYILNCASSREVDERPKAKSLLKQYLTYALTVTIVSFVNALLTFLLSGIIKI